MKKYWRYFLSNLANIFEYRAVPVTWAVIELISVASGIFFWSAVYQDQQLVGQYDLQDMMSYYVLIPFVGTITYVHLATSFPKKIKDGQISVDLLKPYNLATALFFKAIGSMIFKLLIKVPFFIFAAFFLFHFFKIGLGFSNVFLTILVSLLAFGLHFLIDLCLSYLAFWLDDVWAFEHLKLVALMIFGGMTFPLGLLPDQLKFIFNLLPFRFIYYFPISVAQGKVSMVWLGIGVLQIFVWTIFFYMLAKLLWRQGMKKYGAYGN